MRFKPELIIDNVTELTCELLCDAGIRGLLLDVDNTISPPNSPEPFDGVPEWLNTLCEAGIAAIIISNNTGKRVSGLAESLGLDYISMSLKPSPLGLIRARRRLSIPRKELALVGDQIFTDMLAAKLGGYRMFLMEPPCPDPGRLLRLRRRLEVKIKDKWH